VNELERFHACMAYQEVDHAPFWNWGPWEETAERWKREGHRPDVDQPDRECDGYTAAAWFNPTPAFERKIIAEDENTISYVTSEGSVIREMKAFGGSSMPQFIRFPVETREDFRQYWRQRMNPDLTQRVGSNWKERLQNARRPDRPFFAWGNLWAGFFGPLRNLVGVERLCELFYDDPAFLEEMMDADADFTIAVMSQILDVVAVDAFWFWEDMAYKTAPLVSPDLARRYMFPRYRRVVDYLVGRGVKYFALDSDGHIDPLIPVWMDAGINILFPFEAQAGMDVLAVRSKYGRSLRMFGGVDKRTLAKGPAAIDAELARLKPLIEEGGYIPHTDHMIPPDVSFQDYCHYMARLQETCGKRWSRPNLPIACC